MVQVCTQDGLAAVWSALAPVNSAVRMPRRLGELLPAVLARYEGFHENENGIASHDEEQGRKERKTTQKMEGNDRPLAVRR